MTKVLDLPDHPKYGCHDRTCKFHAPKAEEIVRSAGPDLLAALKRLRDLDVNCSQQEDRAAWEEANRAIAKAEGQL